MKKFLLYLSGALYSVKQNLLTWKQPKKYPVIVFLLSFFMLLSPIQFNMVSISNESLISEIPKIENVLKEVSIDLHNKNIDVKIENNKLISNQKYQNNIDGYSIYISGEYNEFTHLIESNETRNDNLIIFSNNRFYARYIERNNELIEDTRTLSGTYNLANTFSFDLLHESNDDEARDIVGRLLKSIFLSNSGPNLIIWVFIIEMFNLMYMLLGGFLLVFFNKKGNRDYRLTYGQSFLTMMGSIIFPSFIASILGMINFSYFTLVYIILALIRLFMLCFVQLSKNEKYNQLKVKIKDENFELNFK